MAQNNRVDEAEQYFEEALTAESVWGYWDEDESRHCGKVLEYATGRVLSMEDLAAVDLVAIENEGFYFSCLEAYLNEKRGSVPWKPSGCYTRLSHDAGGHDAEFCGNCGVMEETGKKLLRCSRCKIAMYCSKDCQVKAWKSGHKRECAISG